MKVEKVFVKASLKTAEDIIFKTLNNAGVISLNRLKALNALNKSMVSSILIKLWEWEQSKKLIIVKGAGKAFSAGGDLKDIFKNRSSKVLPMGKIAYNINNLVANYKIPYVSIMDGMTMGAGLGLAMHGGYRIATENTVIAMPETKVGLVPDIGASYFLPRLPSHLGFYLGLTGNTLSGKDVAAVGIATNFVPSCNLMEMEDALSFCASDKDVRATINKFQIPPEEFTLLPFVKDIDYCFSAKTVEGILNRLTLVKNDWSVNTVKDLRSVCPLSLKLTLKALHQGLNLNLWQSLQMEYRLNRRLILGPNFTEGVRALLADKDKNPQWTPKTVEEINDIDIDHYFDRIPDDELTVLSAKL